MQCQEFQRNICLLPLPICCITRMDHNVGFIGAGNMAQAIGLRFISEGMLKPGEIIVSAPSDRNLSLWRQKGVNTTTNNFDVVKQCDIIFIAVKPQYFEETVRSLFDDDIKPYRMFVSVMAGKTIAYIKKVISSEAQNIHCFDVIRIMPNTPCLIGSGSTVLCHDPDTSASYIFEVERLMSCTGTCDIISEHLVDSVAAICGCGPAFMYLVIESIADGAVRCGVPKDLAIKVASQTVIGAGNMVKKSGKHVGLLKDEVCSPGGTTITGLHELEKAAVRSAFMNAVMAATNRAKELSSSQ